jgi:hypothetical protein
MRHAYSAALAAYDRDLIVLVEVARAYDAFLTELSGFLRSSLESDGMVATIEDGEVQHGGGVSARCADHLGITLQTWASAPYGGAPGRLRMALILDADLPVGLPARADVRRAVLEVLPNAALPDVRDGTDADLVGADVLAWTDFDLAGVGVEREFSSRGIEWAEGLRTATGAVRGLYTPSIPWLREQVKRLRDPARLPGFSQKGEWDGGPYAQAKVAGRPDIWATALPDGSLSFHWQSRPSTDLSTRVYEALSMYRRDPRRDFGGVILLDRAEVAVLCGAGDGKAVEAKVVAALAAYTAA